MSAPPIVLNPEEARRSLQSASARQRAVSVKALSASPNAFQRRWLDLISTADPLFVCFRQEAFDQDEDPIITSSHLDKSTLSGLPDGLYIVGCRPVASSKFLGFIWAKSSGRKTVQTRIASRSLHERLEKSFPVQIIENIDEISSSLGSPNNPAPSTGAAADCSDQSPPQASDSLPVVRPESSGPLPPSQARLSSYGLRRASVMTISKPSTPAVQSRSSAVDTAGDLQKLRAKLQEYCSESRKNHLAVINITQTASSPSLVDRVRFTADAPTLISQLEAKNQQHILWKRVASSQAVIRTAGSRQMAPKPTLSIVHVLGTDVTTVQRGRGAREHDAVARIAQDTFGSTYKIEKETILSNKITIEFLLTAEAQKENVEHQIVSVVRHAIQQSGSAKRLLSFVDTFSDKVALNSDSTASALLQSLKQTSDFFSSAHQLIVSFSKAVAAIHGRLERLGSLVPHEATQDMEDCCHDLNKLTLTIGQLRIYSPAKLVELTQSYFDLPGSEYIRTIFNEIPRIRWEISVIKAEIASAESKTAELDRAITIQATLVEEHKKNLQTQREKEDVFQKDPAAVAMTSATQDNPSASEEMQKAVQEAFAKQQGLASIAKDEKLKSLSTTVAEKKFVEADTLLQKKTYERDQFVASLPALLERLKTKLAVLKTSEVETSCRLNEAIKCLAGTSAEHAAQHASAALLVPQMAISLHDALSDSSIKLEQHCNMLKENIEAVKASYGNERSLVTSLNLPEDVMDHIKRTGVTWSEIGTLSPSALLPRLMAGSGCSFSEPDWMDMIELVRSQWPQLDSNRTTSRKQLASLLVPSFLAQVETESIKSSSKPTMLLR